MPQLTLGRSGEDERAALREDAAVWPATWDAVVTADGLELEHWPFPRATTKVPAASLAEVCVGWAPPAVRTRDGEYLFVPAPRVSELARLAQDHGVPFVSREDVWAWLLEDFLDTDQGDEGRARTLALLVERGLPRDEVESLRRMVGPGMLALTALTWEWQHYGLFDVLCSMRDFTFTTGWTFERFAARAYEVADLGRVRPSSNTELLSLFPGTA